MMKLNSNSDSTPRNFPPGQSPPTPTIQAASVPISVYRELAAELQATRAMVDSLNTRNNQLVQENHQLRQEIERVVHSALSLQQLVDVSNASGPAKPTDRNRPANRTGNPTKPTPSAQNPTLEEAATASAIAAKLRATEASLLSDELLTEEKFTSQQVQQTKPAKDLGGLWLTLTILMVIITAFGAGFLVVRPLLPSR